MTGARVEFGASPSCGCPKREGKIYHQRGTCTDPVAARLDWYSQMPPSMLTDTEINRELATAPEGERRDKLEAERDSRPPLREKIGIHRPGWHSTMER